MNPASISPISAPTHTAVYAYYAQLRARGIHYDEELKCWVASTAKDVQEILQHSACKVRPSGEPVPTALLDSSAGTVFASLVRMNDGDKQATLKQVMLPLMTQLAANKVEASSKEWATQLYQTLQPNQPGSALTDFCYQLPCYVMADLIGFAADQLPQISTWVGSFIRCIAPGGTPAQIAEGKLAAIHLLDSMRALMHQADGVHANNLLQAFVKLNREHAGLLDAEQILANCIGLMTQTYEATAGLISNGLLILAQNPSLLAILDQQPTLLANFIQEVARIDPSIQNTRRFVATDSSICGQAMQAGDVILLVLAAANHDPLSNPEPERFELMREQRQIFTFSAARHACPGRSSAQIIAATAIASLLELGWDSQRLQQPVHYRPSQNARVAELAMSA